GKWRILAVPGPLVFAGLELALDRISSAVAKGLVEPADSVVRRGHEHQVARRPGIKGAVSEHAGHPELGHLRHVLPAQELPLVSEYRIEPGIIRLIADSVVV